MLKGWLTIDQADFEQAKQFEALYFVVLVGTPSADTKVWSYRMGARQLVALGVLEECYQSLWLASCTQPGKVLDIVRIWKLQRMASDLSLRSNQTKTVAIASCCITYSYFLRFYQL